VVKKGDQGLAKGRSEKTNRLARCAVRKVNSKESIASKGGEGQSFSKDQLPKPSLQSQRPELISRGN